MIRWSIDEPAPARIAVGDGSATPISGWCFHTERPIRSVRLLVGGERVPVLAHSLPRPDVRAAHFPDEDPLDLAYASGFFAVLPLRGGPGMRSLELKFELLLDRRLREWRTFDQIELFPGTAQRSVRGLGEPRVAICMATYDPDYERFARQIESISEQSSSGWRCLISDDRTPPQKFDRMVSLLDGDDRFVIDRSERRLGSYHNFERALCAVGPGTELVALSDQDDRWRPEKLDALEEALDGEALLAYSDCRVVRADGTVLAPTFFPTRNNNWTDLRSLIVANTVTGAGTMLKRRLLDDALPFPPYTPRAYHDHWLASVALALGPLAWVERPLWDYVQHGDNLLGHAIGQQLATGAETGEWMMRRRVSYKDVMMRVVALATALELRLDGRIDAAKRHAVGHLSSLERSPSALAALALRSALERPAHASTLGFERELAGAVLWRRRMSRAASKRNRLGDMRFSSTLSVGGASVMSAPALPGVAALTDRIAPLHLSRTDADEPRLNILLGDLAAEGLDDPLAVVLELAARLSAAGVPVRLVPLDRDAAGRVAEAPFETADAPAREQPLAVGSGDVFAATAWWTASIAHAATRELGADRFLYVIRELEPTAGDRPSVGGDARATYELPHHALFVGRSVREEFRAVGVGVYGQWGGGDRDADCVEHPVVGVAPRELDALRARASRRLLLDATGPAALPELGVASLVDASEQLLAGSWELSGIGVERGVRTVELSGGATVELFAPAGRAAWIDAIRAHDVGVALEAGPRPSLAALHMAAAGLVTVTNTSGAKDREAIERVSSNLIAVPATTAGVRSGVAAALERAGDLEARVAGAALDWPSSWDQVFERSLTGRLAALIRARLT